MSSTVAHLEGRIVNPDLRDHSLPGPILESWNNDWSSSILGFRCKKFNQRFGTFKDFPKTLVRKTVSSRKVSKFRLNGCTFDHLSSFLPWRTASVIFFTQEDKILSPESCSFWAPHVLRTNRIPNFLIDFFMQAYKPPLQALVLCFERSDGKEHFQKHSGELGSGSGVRSRSASFTFLWYELC